MASNRVRASQLRKNYEGWKTEAIGSFGYFPVFKPFREGFLLRELSGNAVKLYIYLGLASGNTTGETWVSIETVSKYFDKSPRAVSAWFRELEHAKLIERLQLAHNEASHTFLLPYGEDYFDDPNSLQSNRERSD